jgi:hypothetical protein
MGSRFIFSSFKKSQRIVILGIFWQNHEFDTLTPLERPRGGSSLGMLGEQFGYAGWDREDWLGMCEQFGNAGWERVGRGMER